MNYQKIKSVGKYLYACIPFVLGSCGFQTLYETYRVSASFPTDATLEEKALIAGRVVPSEQQLAWQQMEMTCFICYGINAFTDREWGTGKEDLSLFNPTELDAGQWVRTAQKAGMKMILLTCKHHDGFFGGLPDIQTFR